MLKGQKLIEKEAVETGKVRRMDECMYVHCTALAQCYKTLPVSEQLLVVSCDSTAARRHQRRQSCLGLVGKVVWRGALWPARWEFQDHTECH